MYICFCFSNVIGISASELAGYFFNGNLSLINVLNITCLSILVTDPDSYCMVRVAGNVTYAEAKAACANYKSGWEIPVIRDHVMLEKLGNQTSRYVYNNESLFCYIYITYNIG